VLLINPPVDDFAALDLRARPPGLLSLAAALESGRRTFTPDEVESTAPLAPRTGF